MLFYWKPIIYSIKGKLSESVTPGVCPYIAGGYGMYFMQIKVLPHFLDLHPLPRLPRSGSSCWGWYGWHRWCELSETAGSWSPFPGRAGKWSQGHPNALWRPSWSACSPQSVQGWRVVASPIDPRLQEKNVNYNQWPYFTQICITLTQAAKLPNWVPIETVCMGWAPRVTTQPA